MNKKRIFEIIEVADENDKYSRIYDTIMMFIIIISIFPLACKSGNIFLKNLEKITVIIFIGDYILRLFTADLKLKKGVLSYILYPVTPLAIIDLLSILPSITVLNNSLKLLKIFRLFRTFRVLRVFKAIRYSKSLTIIINVFKKQKESLLAVGGLAIGYIFISALVIFNVEPNTFNTFFDAIYWATVSLTTVGYGDIYAVSFAGKIITMISSVFGIAIVALPAGIVTAGYMDEINRKNN